MIYDDIYIISVSIGFNLRPKASNLCVCMHIRLIFMATLSLLERYYNADDMLEQGAEVKLSFRATPRVLSSPSRLFLAFFSFFPCLSFLRSSSVSFSLRLFLALKTGLRLSSFSRRQDTERESHAALRCLVAGREELMESGTLRRSQTGLNSRGSRQKTSVQTPSVDRCG